MKQGHTVILVDADTRRRAAISHALSERAIHVEPFESIGELASSWPRSGTILLADRTGAVEEAMAAMDAALESFPVIAFDTAPAPTRVVEAVLGGALGYLAWPFDAELVAATLDKVERRAEAVGEARLRRATARHQLARLTDRERQVLSGVAGGLSNRRIGDTLGISPRTVEIHRANMLNKLGAGHTSEAIRIAIEAGIDELPDSASPPSDNPLPRG